MAGRIYREGTFQDAQQFPLRGHDPGFPEKSGYPRIAGIDTRALTKILREKGTMNGMITTKEDYDLNEILPKLKKYTVGDVVSKVTCQEKYVLEHAI